MSKPVWALENNTSLGTLEERTTISIPLQVWDPEDRSTIETSQFENYIDSTIVRNYADELYFWIRSNGLAQTPWGGNPPGYPNNTPVAQDYIFKFPRQRSIVEVVNKTPALGIIGVARDGVPIASPNSEIKATIGDKVYTENRVIYPIQDFFTDGSGIVGDDRKFYYCSDPRLIYNKVPGQHSPIIGYAFDGNPIYGPYGYSDPTDENSPVKVMETSYRYTEVQRSNNTLPDGSYIEDFVYEVGLGDLDRHNGRFCKTPEYPGGVYAYFVTVDPSNVNEPKYPYIVGPTYFNEPILPNGSFEFPGDIAISVISGELPPGLRINGYNIVGTPYEVYREKEFRFVLRATNLDGVTDRTFTLTVSGADAPIWLTKEGLLPVGVVGEKIDSDEKITDGEATAGSTIIKLKSVSFLTLGSVVTSDQYPNFLAENTILQSTDPISKTIKVSPAILGNIPNATTLKFTYSTVRKNYFIIDNTFVDYQLEAIDNDLPTGEKLSYFIPPRGGELPPGLTLTKDGKITGFVQPILAPETGDGTNGFYDMNFYDKFGYDYGVRPNNGWDSFLYDNQVFDKSDPIKQPRKLNRYYEFVVRVSDGVYFSDRKFRIFVVGDDIFQTDNFRANTTIIFAGTNIFTADITFLRKPIWLTPPYLGRRRANNYITTFIEIFESPTLAGTIGYLLDPINDDGSPSQLPPGMTLDQLSGEIYGDVPYQPAVTKTYKFTIRAVRYDPENYYYAVSRVAAEYAPALATTIKLDSVDDIKIESFLTSAVISSSIQAGTIVTAIDKINKTITINRPLLGPINAGDQLLLSYLISSSRTFTLDIMGEVDTTIRFISPGDLGTIPANFVSNLSVEAITTVPNAVLKYSLIGGKLPPGLILFNDGTIQGKVDQFATPSKPGLTTFDNLATSFDNFDTSFDREYRFIVLAEDQYKYSATSKVFRLLVTTPNDRLYSNIYIKPFLKVEKRLELVTFFTDPTIFEYQRIYRIGDPEFGIQTELKMLLYPGIETKSIEQYVSALGRSSKKRFRFGSIKKAIAKTPGTNNVVYEAVYIEIIDNLETAKGSISPTIETRFLNRPVVVNQGKKDVIDSDPTDNNIARMNEDVLPRIFPRDKVMTTDYDGQRVSEFNRSNVFGNSVTNLRKAISKVGDTERNFLPLWMRTPQTQSGVDQGFTKAIVLCYCKPGEADRTILNIKNSGFDFKKIDFTVDRAIIDSVSGETGDKYIAFAAREVING